MRVFRIIFALLRVPRLFANLLLFPLIGSLLVVLGQVIVSSSALRAISVEEKISTQTEQTPEADWNFIRAILFGSGMPTAEPLLCIWEQDPKEKESEHPTTERCRPDRLDVSLHIEDNIAVNFEDYLKLIRGNALRLHVCKKCKPDLQLIVSKQGNSVRAHSTYGLLLYSLLILDKDLQQQFKSLRDQRQELKEKLGDVSLYLPELKAPVGISTLRISVILVLNITAIVVTALWLGLRAHRKVLDYFSKSGALLPMVAASGKTNFYIALWGITTIRVALFLIASMPLLYVLFKSSDDPSISYKILGNNFFECLLWFIALISSMSLATLFASISDLKGRHEILSIMYKVAPLLISGFGAIIWSLSFLALSDSAGVFRNILTAVPVLGMAPVILAAIAKPNALILIIHSISSLILCFFLMKKNAHWFAAHLEEI